MIPVLDAHIIRVVQNGKDIVWQFGASHFTQNVQKALDFFKGKGNQVQLNVVGHVDANLKVLMIRNPTPFDLDHFKTQLTRCRPMTPEEHDGLLAIYAPNGNMTSEERDQFVESDHGYLERNTSAAILPYIYNTEKSKLLLWPAMETSTDLTLTIDLDHETFSVTNGALGTIHTYLLNNLPERWPPATA